MKSRFATISDENLEDIMQDLCLKMLNSERTFDTNDDAYRYWGKAYLNQCKKYCDRQRRKKEGKEKRTRCLVPRAHWRNPRFKKHRLTFAGFTISELEERLAEAGLLTPAVHYCILCDARGEKRARVSEENAISLEELARLIRAGRRQLEDSLLTFYLIDDRSSGECL